MQDTIKSAVLVALLTQLQDEIGRKDGAAAVATIELIGTVAGPDYQQWLMDQLLTAGLQRLAEKTQR